MKKLKRGFYLFLLLFVLGCTYLHLSQDPMLATLNVTGVTSQEEVEWKSPHLPLEKALLPTHEIFFSFYKEPMIHAFFWGDVIGVRYKALEFHPFFHWLGFADFIEIEALCSDYIDLEKKIKFPSKVMLLEKKASSKFTKIYRSVWKKLFQDTSGNFFIRRATLKIEYFPLDETNRSFHLSCEQGKLVSH